MLSLKAFEVPGVKVLRLESPLYFGNAERFRNALIATAGVDPGTRQQQRKEVKLDKNNSDDQEELLDHENEADHVSNGNIANGVSSANKFQGSTTAFSFPFGSAIH